MNHQALIRGLHARLMAAGMDASETGAVVNTMIITATLMAKSMHDRKPLDFQDMADEVVTEMIEAHRRVAAAVRGDEEIARP